MNFSIVSYQIGYGRQVNIDPFAIRVALRTDRDDEPAPVAVIDRQIHATVAARRDPQLIPRDLDPFLAMILAVPPDRS